MNPNIDNLKIGRIILVSLFINFNMIMVGHYGSFRRCRPGMMDFLYCGSAWSTPLWEWLFFLFIVAMLLLNFIVLVHFLTIKKLQQLKLLFRISLITTISIIIYIDQLVRGIIELNLGP